MRTFEDVPALAADTQLTVVIPARDEEASIGRALSALATQRHFDGRPLRRNFDVIVYANQCRDATAQVVRAFAARAHVAAYVFEGALPAHAAHVGTARKIVMDVAAARFEAAEMPRGIIASTDADTVVDQHWIAATLAEARSADAVMGRIMLAAHERAALPYALRRLYLRDMAYRRLLGELEAARDPVAHDPLPRHGQHYGASFAVTARAYRRAGGLPPLPALEDLALFAALEGIDARVRHSLRVRVATSARALARVSGGFSTYLDALRERADGGQPLVVEHPAVTLARIDGRAALRRLYAGDASPGGVDTIVARYGITRYRLRRLFERADYFGANVRRIETLANDAWACYAPVPIEVALCDLRCAFKASSVFDPTRAIAASGAG